MVLRLQLSFMIGILKHSMVPMMIADTLNSFCVTLYTKSIAMNDAFIEVFEGKWDFLSSCLVVLMQRDPLTQVSGKNDS